VDTPKITIHSDVATRPIANKDVCRREFAVLTSTDRASVDLDVYVLDTDKHAEAIAREDFATWADYGPDKARPTLTGALNSVFVDAGFAPPVASRCIVNETLGSLAPRRRASTS
jgi:hypothetical protein